MSRVISFFRSRVSSWSGACVLRGAGSCGRRACSCSWVKGVWGRGGPGRWRVVGVACVLAGVSGVGVVSCSGGQGVSDQESVDPWAVAASLDAARATASASVQASRDAVLGPELVAQREAALAMEEPVRPSEVEQDDGTGAGAAAYYFVSLYPYVYATGDLTAWKDMSESTCQFCQSVVDNVTELHKDGGWRDPWEQTITDVAYWDRQEGYDYNRVEVTINSVAITAHSGDNSSVETAEPVDGTVVRLSMRYVNGRWVVGGGSAE